MALPQAVEPFSIEDDDWRDHAACRDTNPDLFFPVGTTGPAIEQIDQAKASNLLKLVAQGMSNREVAEDLFISENTVKNHVRNILEKLHLHSRMEAVVYAVREKLLDIH